MGSETRKRTKHILVRVSPDELETITEQAKAFSYPSNAALLRDLALGIEPKSTLDQQAILDLVKVNADLGRLGGLLKHWLQSKGVEAEQAIDIRQLLRDIERTQSVLRERVLAL